MFSRTASRARLLLVALVAATLVLAGSTLWQAQAHDRLVGSDPGAEATTDSPIDSLTLSFNNAPQDVEPRAVVTGVGTGEIEIESIAVVDRDVVVTFTEPLPNDVYSVAWRVVSSDGHPIEGELTFTVDAPMPEPTDVPTEEPVEDPTSPSTDSAATEPVEQPSTAPTPADDESDDNGLPLWLIVIVGVGAIGATAVVLIQKTRRHNA